jgi:hypothetical protein
MIDLSALIVLLQIVLVWKLIYFNNSYVHFYKIWVFCFILERCDKGIYQSYRY